jgi:hypothetical protein
MPKMVIIFSGSKVIVVVGCHHSRPQRSTVVDFRFVSELKSFSMAAKSPNLVVVGCCHSQFYPLSVDNGLSICWEE